MMSEVNLNYSPIPMPILNRNTALEQHAKVLPFLRVKRRILIIEDDHEMAMAIKFFIESLDRRTVCTIVEDPYEALLVLSDHRFDYILMDQRLPGLTGSDMLVQMDKFIAQDPLIIESGNYQKVIPVILMSGSEIFLDNKMHLENFKIVKCIKKTELPDFLATNFQ